MKKVLKDELSEEVEKMKWEKFDECDNFYEIIEIETDEESASDNLKEERKLCEMTQEELAKFFGVSKALVQKWENGTRTIPEDAFDKLYEYRKNRVKHYSVLIEYANSDEFREELFKVDFNHPNIALKCACDCAYRWLNASEDGELDGVLITERYLDEDGMYREDCPIKEKSFGAGSKRELQKLQAFPNNKKWDYIG